MSDPRVVFSEINLDLLDRLESLTPADVLWRAIAVADEEGPVYLAVSGEKVAAIVSLAFVEAAPLAAFSTQEEPSRQSEDQRDGS